MNVNKEFQTYQPSTITPNKLTEPTVFNGMCLVRKYKVTVEEIIVDDSIIEQRLRYLWDRRSELKITHSSNIQAMQSEASKIGITLD